jgi:predicted RNA-binding protein with PIN domain
MREAWKRNIWIVDGHNAIFAIPVLSALQQSGERPEARRGLESMLRPFAHALTHPLVVVYDGNRLLPNPDAMDTPELRTLYSQPPEEADDRIAFLAGEARRRGQSVVVVSNDRRSLAPRLAPGVRVMGVTEFQERCLMPASRTPRPEPSREDCADLERHFLERQDDIEQTARAQARRLEAESRRRWEARTGSLPERAARETDRDRSRVPAARAETTRVCESPSRAPRPDAGTADGPHSLSESARRQAEQSRARKRRRGERQQARRLEQLRHSSGRGGRRAKQR